MSAPLIAGVGMVYLWIAVEQCMKGNPGMAICFGGYALANVGMFMMAK